MNVLETANRLNLKVGLSFNESEAWVSLKKQVDNLQKRMDGYTEGIKDVGKETEKTTKKIEAQKTSMQKLGDSVKSAVGQFLKFALISAVFLSVTTQIRRAVELMIELDTAFTNFRIVTNATADEVAQVDQRVTELTTSLGRLKTEIIDAVTEFSRAGFSISDSLILAENAIKGANVGATDLANVTTFLIAGLKSFKLEAEDSARILDVLFRVANSTAINLEGIGDAFLRSANTLQVAGASLEESASLIAAANESIQDPAKVGTALKTIASRLRGIGDEGEVVPTLAKDFKAVGIEIQNADGSFRNIYDIFKDFSEVYKTLDDLTKESLLEKIAGKRQKNILIGLVENFDTAEMALEEALNSAGSVAEANEKYLDSLSGRLTVLKAEWQSLTQTIVDSDLTKLLIGALTDLIKLFNSLNTTIGNLTISVSAFLIGFKTFALIGTGFGAIVPIIALVASAVAGLGFVTKVTKSEFEKLGVEIGKINSKISELQSKVDSLRNKKNITESEERYLKILEQQLATEKELYNLRSQEQANLKNKEVLSEIEKVNNALQKQADIESGLVKFRKGGKEYSIIPNVERDLAELDKLQTSLIETRGELVAISSDLKVGTSAYDRNQESISSVDEALKSVSQRYKELGFESKFVADSITDTNDTIMEQVSLLDQTRNSISYTISEQELLTKAFSELDDAGALNIDTLNELLVAYPKYQSQLGLSVDAQKEFIQSILDGNTRALKSEQDYLISKKESLLKRIDLIMAETNAMYELFDITQMVNGLPPLPEGFKTTRLLDIKKELEGIDTSISLYNNAIALADSYSKSTGKSTKKTSDTNKALTDQERALEDINYQIDLQIKLVQRLKGEDQDKANLKLIELYKEQSKAIQAVIDVKTAELSKIDKSTSKYDDAIETLRKLNLQQEDVRNSIYGIIDALQQEELARLKAEKESKRDAEKDAIDEIKTKLDKFFEDEINSIQEAKEANDDYYDSKIDAIQSQIDAQKTANEQLDEQLELQQKISDLEDLRQKKANILSNKNVKRVENADLGFVAIADPRELEKVNEDIKSAEADLADYRRNITEKEYIRSLEAQQTALEKAKNVEDTILDTRLKNMEKYQTETSELLDNGGKITEELAIEIADTVKQIESDNYQDRLSILDTFIAEYNARIATLNNLNMQLGGYSSGSIYSGASSSSSSSSSSGFNLDDVLFRTDSTTNSPPVTTVSKLVANTNTNGSSASGITFNNTTVVTPNTQSWVQAVANKTITKG